MNWRCPILISALLFVPAIARSEPHALKFVEEIGVGWGNDKWGWMSFVAFSPDGKTIASDASTSRSDVSGNLTLWSFPEGRLIKQLPGRPEAISGDWKYYATFHSVREIATGKPVISVPDSVFPGYAFGADSRYVAESVHGKGTRCHIRIVELANGRQAGAFGRHCPFSIAISPDGMTLAAGHWDIVTLWNMFTDKKVGVLRGFGRYVEGLAFSKDGTLLAGGTDAGGLQIWDVQHQTRLKTLFPGGDWRGPLSNPAFSPDGKLVAVGMYGSGTAYLIDVNNGTVLDRAKVSDLGCGSVAFSPDGRFLVTPSTGGLVTWPYDHGGTIRVFEVHSR